jgi:hypothetical protein
MLVNSIIGQKWGAATISSIHSITQQRGRVLNIPVKYFQSMRRPCGGQLTLSKVSAIEETVCTIFHTGTKLGLEGTSKNLLYKVLPLL